MLVFSKIAIFSKILVKGKNMNPQVRYPRTLICGSWYVRKEPIDPEAPTADRDTYVRKEPIDPDAGGTDRSGGGHTFVTFV